MWISYHKQLVRPTLVSRNASLSLFLLINNWGWERSIPIVLLNPIYLLNPHLSPQSPSFFSIPISLLNSHIDLSSFPSSLINPIFLFNPHFSPQSPSPSSTPSFSSILISLLNSTYQSPSFSSIPISLPLPSMN